MIPGIVISDMVILPQKRVKAPVGRKVCFMAVPKMPFSNLNKARYLMFIQHKNMLPDG